MIPLSVIGRAHQGEVYGFALKMSGERKVMTQQ